MPAIDDPWLPQRHECITAECDGMFVNLNIYGTEIRALHPWDVEALIGRLQQVLDHIHEED